MEEPQVSFRFLIETKIAVLGYLDFMKSTEPDSADPFLIETELVYEHVLETWSVPRRTAERWFSVCRQLALEPKLGRPSIFNENCVKVLLAALKEVESVQFPMDWFTMQELVCVHHVSFLLVSVTTSLLSGGYDPATN